MDSLTKNHKFSNSIQTNFKGGQLTNDSGILLYNEFDHTFGFSKIIKDMDQRYHNPLAKYQLSDLIIQKVYQLISGYYTDDCADDLKSDELFQLILNKRVASQPTLSRINHQVSEELINHLSNISLKLLERAYQIEKPNRVIIDCDSTINETYGNQELSEFIYHYGAVGYHPLLAFDGMTGDFMKGQLRRGKNYTSTGISDFIKPVFTFYKDQSIDDLYFRGDSGFAVPELYDLCEEEHYNVKYVIRLKANNKLYEAVADIEADFYENPEEMTRYVEFVYKAASWKKARRVICKLEKKSNELLAYKTFIITNDQAMSPEEVVQFYCQRGTMENFIKESKLGFNLKNLSSHSFLMNYYHMLVKLITYSFNNLFRRLVLPKEERSYQIETLRTKLIKIAGKIIKTGRRVIIKMNEAHPYKQLYNKVIERLGELKIRFSA